MDRHALWTIVRTALRVNLRRLTTWVFAAVFVALSFLLYGGGLRIGGMTASGVRLAANSDYAVAAMLGAFSFLLMHFTATLTGDPIVRDVRLGVGPLVWTTPLERRTYVLGRFLGGYLSLLALYAVFVGALWLGQLFEFDATDVLPFRSAPYLRFGLLFVVVTTFFVGAVSFALGTLTGNMKVVYITVTGFFIGFFLVLRALDDQHLRWLAYWEPSGMTWLAERVAKSRGNAWLNQHPIEVDAGFLLNRLALVVLGVLALRHAVRRFEPREVSAELGGEIRPGAGRRLVAWLRGRQRRVADGYTNWVGPARVAEVVPRPDGPVLFLHQLAASLATELRLLLAERSLWIAAPMIVFFCAVDVAGFTGPFQVPVYPVSSEYVQQMATPLLILLAGTTIFYTGEVFHRDAAHGVRGLLHATPVRAAALLGGKLGAMLVCSAAMIALTAATAMVSQAVTWWLLDRPVRVELAPYAAVLGRVVLPAAACLCALSLAVNVLVRGRYAAYFTLLALAGLYVWRVLDRDLSLVENPLLIGQWGWSDLTGLEPFARRLALHHAYWLGALGALLALASLLLGRTGAPLSRQLSRARLRRRWATSTGLVLLAALALGSALRIRAAEREHAGGADPEATRLRLEQDYGALVHAPRLTWRRVDLEVDLHPERGALDVRGEAVLVNDGPEPVETARFTVDPRTVIRTFRLERQARAHSLDEGVLEVPLTAPLARGDSTRLALDWSVEVSPGVPARGGAGGPFVHARASFLSSFAPHVLPLCGVSPSLFLEDAERRRELGLPELDLLPPARAGEAWVPGLLGVDRPFDLRLAVSVPRGLAVVSAGELVERRVEGPREVFVWQSAEPLTSFPLLAGRWEVERRGDDEILHHPSHAYNLETIGAALSDGRASFERWFGPYPHRALRVVEFPRLSSFAQSYPTVMPYSESIGFLSNYRHSPDYVDVTYFVTAHEVAHQWWGHIAPPGAREGAEVLTESLAEYSAMALLGETRGEEAHLGFLRREEDAYLRRRDPDEERPLLELDHGQPATAYNKGCLVLHMLERRIGREALLGALRAHAERWRRRPGDGPRSHATLPDLLAELRAAHRGLDLEDFYEHWFERVDVPDPALLTALLRSEGRTWSIDFTAADLAPAPRDGRGPRPRLELCVEAVAGAPGEPGYRVGPSLRLVFEPGEIVRGTLACDFRPDALVLDRWHEVIDFDRTNNRLEPEAGPTADAPQRPEADAATARRP